MMKRTNVRKAWLYAGASAFAITAAAPGLAFAQDADDQSSEVAQVDEEEEEIEPVEQLVVTGSRIRRDEFSISSPVQIISGEVSRDLGLVEADSILRQTSVVTGQQTTLGLSTFVGAGGQAFTTFGSVTPSLRGLQSSVTGRTRNLFLINGRRFGPIGVGGAPANPSVNLIPATLVERVDILLDGASSVYGSDAIAGAINYILQDDFEGFELNAFVESPQIGQGKQFIVSGKVGAQSDRGSIVIAGEYNDLAEVTLADRFPHFLPPIETDFGPVICNPEREINTITGEVFSGCAGGLAGFAVFGPTGTTFPTPGETNIGIPGFSALGTAPFDGPDSDGVFGSVNNPFTRFFPQDQDTPFQPTTSRFSIYAIGDYQREDIYTAPTFYFELQYSEQDLSTRSFAQSVTEVTEDTPFNPGLGSTLLVGLQQLDFDQNISLFRATGGLRGELPFLNNVPVLDDFGFGNWTYDVFALFHRSNGVQSNFGDLNENNRARVLNGFVDENNQFQCALDESLADSQPSRLGPGGGFVTPPTECFAVNFFDPQFLTTGRFSDPASNDFILTNAIQTTLIDQVTISGFVGGDLFENPFAGTVQFVAGFEYRTDQILTVNDQNQSTPGALAALDPDLGSTGDRRIVEGFAEMLIPLVSDLPFVKTLEAELAVRYTEEEFFGAGTTWQAKGTWAPYDWLVFSGGYGTSFRAPDTGEQFGTGIVFANLSRADPCLPPTDTLDTAPPEGITVDGVAIPGGTVFFNADLDERPQETIDICNALGIQLPSGPLDVDGAQALGLFGLGTPSGSFQNFTVLTGNSGNDAIDPETSRAFFAKVTFDQPWFDSFGFRLSANYFDYLVEDTIAQLTTGVILGNCFSDPNTQVINGELVGDLCQFQERSPTTGLLTAINEASFNLGALTSRGVDINLEIDYDLTFLESVPVVQDWLDSPLRLILNYRATRQLENNEDISGDGTFLENLGEFGFPTYQHNITTRLQYERFSLLHRVFFASATDNGLDPFGGGTLCEPELTERGEPQEIIDGCTEFIDLPPVIQHDLTAVYNADNYVLRFGIRNLLNRVIVRDGALGGGSGTPFGLGYDATGRSFFGNLVLRF